MVVQLIADMRALRDIVPAWQSLARNALEPNPFYESWALLPALEWLAPSAGIQVLLVWADSAHSSLLGLFPLRQDGQYRRFPARHWRNWLHQHCPLGTPLVHQNYALEVFAALFAWLHGDAGATVFSLDKVPAEGALANRLRQFVRQQGLYLDERDSWERALLCNGLSGDAYLLAHHSKKRLKEYARLQRRLEDLGEVEFAALMPGQGLALSHWIGEFLDLEAKGWKGRTGTAMACSDVGRGFAEGLMRNAAEQGRLMMLALRLEGRTIALKLNLLDASELGGYALKIAYDEDYAAYSPGVLLELENVYRVLDGTGVAWMDSCAVPNHPMINHLWVGRRRMANFHISTQAFLSKPLLYAVHLVRTVYRACQGVKR